MAEQAQRQIFRRARVANSTIRATAFQVVSQGDGGVSRQLAYSDEFLTLASAAGATIVLPPPYNVPRLFEVIQRSNMIQQCIDAYIVNTVQTGWECEPIMRGKAIDDSERVEMESFLDNSNSEESLTDVMEKVLRDRESVGFGFQEIIRDASGGLSLLRHCPALWTRLCSKDPTQIKVSYTISRGRRVSVVEEYRRFRRYVQIVNGQHVWFKEYGDPRRMDYTNGAFEGQSGFDADRLATEIFMWKRPSNDSYGAPQWITQLPNIIGSREAEEVNMRYFQDNTVPPMMLLIGNGRLTSQSFKELTRALNSPDEVGVKRQNKIMLIEAVGDGDSMDGKSSPIEIKIEKLTDARQSDGLFKSYDEGNMAKIRSSYRLPPITVGMSQEVNFACTSADTETLTEAGWKFYWEVTPNDRIATYNPETKGLEFHKPIGDIHLYDYDGLMHRYANRNCDILVTPNHRMWWAPRQYTREPEFRITRADAIPSQHVFFTSAPEVFECGNTLDEFHIPHISRGGGHSAEPTGTRTIPGDAFLRLVGVILGDGSVSLGNRRYNIRLGATKARKLALFDAVWQSCIDAGLNGNQCTMATGAGQYKICDRGLAQWFADNCGRLAGEKHVPEDFMNLNARQSQIILQALLDTDGHHQGPRGEGSTRDSWNFCSTSRQLADQVQILALKCGYRTCSIYYPSPEHWQVRLVPGKPIHMVKPDQMTTEYYKGKVYCFEVPNHLFVTRRNGKVAIQGNTASTSAFVAESQVFCPERVKIDGVLNRNFINGRNGLNMTSLKLVSRIPSITSPEMMIKTLTALNVMGAVTPRTALNAANKVMQVELPPYPEKGDADYEEWMDMPLVISAQIAKMNAANIEASSKADAISADGQLASPQNVQAQKDPATKKVESTGDVGPAVPKHGTE